MIVDYCECGSSIRLCAIDERELGPVVNVWKAMHVGHERVNAVECDMIRSNERKRRKKRAR